MDPRLVLSRQLLQTLVKREGVALWLRLVQLEGRTKAAL